MTQENEWQAVAPSFKESKTNTGTDIYACIQCFKGTPDQDTAKPFRVSAPFVFSRRYVSRLSFPFIPSCLPTTARLSGTDIILSQWIL